LRTSAAREFLKGMLPDKVGPASNYWSSTSFALSPNFAWNVLFYNGLVFAVDKSLGLHVRAVRGGL
jgi:hypothetical protein